MKTHPEIGAQIIERLKFLNEAAGIVKSHHERPDGRGYPDRLRDHQIPIGAGVVAVAEAYDAMVSPRPYRHSRSRREALREVREKSGTQFTVEAADALLSLPGDRL